MILESIHGAEDVKRLSLSEQKALAKELRRFILEKTSMHGGHLASNLGVVELTIALFHSLNLPQDKLVWDTSAIPIRFFPEEWMTLMGFDSWGESAVFPSGRKVPMIALIPATAPPPFPQLWE